MSFKDVMSLIPSSVSVISCLEEGIIYGCTISSLVSVDVNDEHPEIIFVLRKHSYVGDKIKTTKVFTINVLSASQDEIAKKYSSERLPESTSNSSWIIQDKFVEISKCRATMNCKLLKIYDNHAADIIVGQVIKHSGNQRQSSLIYDARKYGSFQSH